MNNLFTFATSELSQDAFICWLLNFAHKDHLNEDELLRNCAKEFLSKIIKTKYTLNEEPVVTSLWRQYKNIDILVQVNGTYHIIIEDKTYTSQHGDQINRYKQQLEDEGKRNILTVYYKISEQAQQEDVDVSMMRSDMLNLFQPYAEATNNNIFIDYYQHLRAIEEEVNSFKHLDIKEWSSHAYRGFFTEITTGQGLKGVSVDRGHSWGYVPNQSGGFHGLWWYFIEGEELKKSGLYDKGVEQLYLQIENNQIVIKINSDRPINDVKWEIYNYLKNSDLIPEIKKKRFRNGKAMSVGYIEYNQTNYDEKIKIMEHIMDVIVNANFYLSQ